MVKIASRLMGGNARGQLWKRAWFGCALVVAVAVIGNAHSGRTLPSGSDDVLALGYEQRVTMGLIVNDALRLDAAVGGEEYDGIDPALESLERNVARWEQAHQKLSKQVGSGIDEPIARLVNPYTQIDRGLDELLLVAKSAQRRAPYLDQETADRIRRARILIGEHELQYTEGLVQITAMRQGIIDERIAGFRGSSRAGLVVLIVVAAGCVPIVVFPALAGMGAGSKSEPGLKISEHQEPGKQTRGRAA
ncbi:MAG: hypothetical protein JKY96_03785 [Phycisphaerales bacterium]|nr:hypothetical protein [Phycisphaerales bacterium]